VSLPINLPFLAHLPGCLDFVHVLCYVQYWPSDRAMARNGMLSVQLSDNRRRCDVGKSWIRFQTTRLTPAFTTTSPPQLSIRARSATLSGLWSCANRQQRNASITSGHPNKLWTSGNAMYQINKVDLCWASATLVLGCAGEPIQMPKHPDRLTQPSTLHGTVKWVSAGKLLVINGDDECSTTAVCLSESIGWLASGW